MWLALAWKKSGKSIPNWEMLVEEQQPGELAAPCPSQRDFGGFLALTAESQMDFWLSQPQLVQLTLALLPLQPQFPQIPTAGAEFVLSPSRSTSTRITQQSQKKDFFVVSCSGSRRDPRVGLSPSCPLACHGTSAAAPPFPSLGRTKPSPKHSTDFWFAFRTCKPNFPSPFPAEKQQINSQRLPHLAAR